ncbi:MAG: 4-hydroxy-tetrahydrodipicolinate reductase [Parachlamydiaceae bacterium]
MKIALIGYGKMGKLIREKAVEKGYTITAIVNSTTSFSDPLISAGISAADVCIDFSHPQCVLNNVKALAGMKKSIVMGTTGWADSLDEVLQIAQNAHIGFIHSPNFSLGIALFLAIVEQAASLIGPLDDYDAAGYEIHHHQKVDSPSGTAKILADAINKHRTAGSAPLSFSSVRVGHVPGTHSVLFDSTVDTITLTHTARNKEGFALGALKAAEWLRDKQGIFTMSDFLLDKGG